VCQRMRACAEDPISIELQLCIEFVLRRCSEQSRRAVDYVFAAICILRLEIQSQRQLRTEPFRAMFAHNRVLKPLRFIDLQRLQDLAQPQHQQTVQILLSQELDSMHFQDSIVDSLTRGSSGRSSQFSLQDTLDMRVVRNPTAACPAPANCKTCLSMLDIRKPKPLANRR
jgi:hypothetical protein